MSGFFGLEIGKRAIFVNQTALNTVGHNMANANTTGYSKQVTDLTAGIPLATPSLTNAITVGQLGTGVTISAVERMRDAYVDRQYRYENTSAGYWEATQQSLDKIEVIINEPSDNGLRSVIDEFWSSWEDLAANPENSSTRAVVAQRGEALADTFQHMYKQLSDLKQDLNANVQIDVDQINTLGTQIKDLNIQIAAIMTSGQSPNDLEDKRDVLVDELSKLVKVNITDGENNMVNIQIGGRSLVQGAFSNKLDTAEDSDGMHMVVWDDTRVRTDISGGELKAFLDARGKTTLSQEKEPSEYNETVPNLMEQLNSLAESIITRTNQVHSQGYSLNNKTGEPDNTNFFNMPTDTSPDSYLYWARDMTVSTAIIEEPNNIAAAAARTWDASGNKSNFGDGDNALALAGLKQNMNNNLLVFTDGIPLTANAAISFDIVRSGLPNTTITISPAPPPDVYTTTAERAQAIQDAIEDAGLTGYTVTANGERLVFSSTDASFTGINSLTVNSVAYGDNNALQMVSGCTNDDFWRSVAAEIGVKAEEAARNSENQDTLVSELDNKRQSVSGVSLDEEATDMIKYQHAFNAAARYITVIDEMLQTIVEKMGIAGR
ncbi:MAG: flagellar hook-associated protein FlgK [Syntrophomonas sp.]